MCYYIMSIYDDTFRKLRRSSEEEYNKITSLNKKINSLLVDGRRIDGVVNAYKKLNDAAYSVMVNSRSSSTMYDLGDCLSNYLFHARKYLDNWNAYIDRTYGKDSDFFKCFKAATAYEYDNHMEYRIMYELRHFDQHISQIISSTSVGLLENGGRYLRVLIDRDRLLKEFSSIKKE